jgi:hypothetical protein
MVTFPSSVARYAGRKKRGWSLGYVAAVDSQGRTIWIADAHRDNGKRFIVKADEKLTTFLELERVTREFIALPNCRLVGHNSCMTPLLSSKASRRINPKFTSLKTRLLGRILGRRL